MFFKFTQPRFRADFFPHSLDYIIFFIIFIVYSLLFADIYYSSSFSFSPFPNKLHCFFYIFLSYKVMCHHHNSFLLGQGSSFEILHGLHLHFIRRS